MATPDTKEKLAQREVKLHPSQERTLTKEQKRQIREDRDKNRCQYPGPHNCNDHEQTPHVHHVTPFGVATRIMGKSAAAADSPENLLTVCEDIHTGGRLNPQDKIIHPDIPRARREYGQGDKDSFRKLSDRRSAQMQQGQTYHNTEFDTEMKILAHVQTSQAIEEGRFSRDRFKAAGKRPTRRTKPE